MKTFLILTMLTLFGSKSSAQIKDLVLEIGQEQTLKKSVSRIWVENPKVIAVLPAPSEIKIKALAMGQTRLRLGSEVWRIFVVPIGSLESFEDWKKFARRFVGVKVDFCDEVVCLKGQIYRLQDYRRILELIKENSSSIYLAFSIQPSLVSDVQRSLEKYQREKGLTPLKVIFSEPWRLQYANKETAADYRAELARIGILAIESKQKVEIADNIKVSIQVTEVKKDFGRSLGLKYPGAYSAQVINTKELQQLPFELTLNAHESEGDVKILASPNLVCRSGKEAEFFAGGEFPIRILNFKVNDVVWKKYGINLKVKPQIDSIGQMSLQIDSEVSTLDQSTQVDGIPGIQTHKVSSYFDLLRTRTIALSGLIKNEQGRSSEGLPFLKQIPILGRLFSSHDFRESRTELVIFVTPELMKSEGD